LYVNKSIAMSPDLGSIDGKQIEHTAWGFFFSATKTLIEQGSSKNKWPGLILTQYRTKWFKGRPDTYHLITYNSYEEEVEYNQNKS
jgi:hypothetical protein